ncbi:YqaE/Pmp3 family membrane protein [Helicobacter cetorum]|uniref:YqaE/Pmp3 family membrane protein n=1 Tax=Helicobacter cetorum TaxID=138563 RepID=UPI000CF13B9E|nr:YqaE/Pmp3 family membrane protein [Helicobacter cetorum]
MRYLIAFFVPWLVFFTIKRYMSGVICLLLQMTLIGWIPAMVWAIVATNGYHTDKKIQKALRAIQKENQQ